MNPDQGDWGWLIAVLLWITFEDDEEVVVATACSCCRATSLPAVELVLEE